MRLYFDLEGNGLLKEITKIWCIAAIDLDSDEEFFFGPSEIREGVEFLEQADHLCGHNVIRYDLPALKKVANFKGKQGQTVSDTLVMARVKFPNIKVTDSALVASGKLHSSYHGKDSLAAWGQRIAGIQKSTYEGGFESYNDEMGDYCRQDVRAGKGLYQHLNPHETLSPFVLATEHRITEITFLMEEEGWLFDQSKATSLHVQLATRLGELEKGLVEKYGEWEEVAKVFVAKRDIKSRGIKAGDTVTNMKTVVFNPGSRKHIEKVLREAGWEPQVFTEGGAAKLDETVLEGLDIPEAKELIEYLLIQKRLGMLAEGDNAWLKQVDSRGFIHPSYNCMGTVTGRASHFHPNIAQVPKVGSAYGADCRELFTCPPGWTMVGADFEGLELRCFAHFVGSYDGGEYARQVVSGDVHWLNTQLLGLVGRNEAKDPNNKDHKVHRDTAKTFIYAFLYGAGVAKIAKILGVKIGRARNTMDRFMENFPALARLRHKVKLASEKGFLKGIDGRHIPVRAAHAALNSLLQSMGAVLCKNWVIDAFEALEALGLKHGYQGDFVFLAWVHDEVQVAFAPHIDAEAMAKVIQAEAVKQQQKFNLNVELGSSYAIGRNWKETH